MIQKRRYFYNHFQGVQQRRRSSVFSVNFEHISYLLLVFRLLALNIHLSTGLEESMFIVS